MRLCYVECATDAVPIAANSCASAADSSAPSRILETVAADFSWTIPNEAEISGTADYAANKLATLSDSTKIHTVLEDWALNSRPTLSTSGCLPSADSGDCLLLAQISFSTDSGGNLTNVTLKAETGAVLADTRLLQEWLAALQAKAIKIGDAATGDISGNYPGPITVTKIQNNPVASGAPADGNSLIWSQTDKQWEPKPVIKPGDAASRDLSGTYPDPTVVQIQGNKVAPGTPPSDGVALIWSDTDKQWEPKAIPPPLNVIKTGDAAGGDLIGPYPNPTLAKIQTIPVVAPAPKKADVLTFNGTQWQPQPIPAPVIPPVVIPPVVPFATIQSTGNGYSIWFHLAVGTNNGITLLPTGTPAGTAPPTVPAGAVEMFMETLVSGAAPNFLTPVKLGNVAPSTTQRNTWIISMSPLPNTPLRFVFHLNIMQATIAPSTTGISLLEVMKSSPILWEGFDSTSGTVTIFLTVPGSVG